jgi:y4mF family transcriptional regulator
MTPKQIGQIIRETRRAQALRQDQLAGAAGVGLRFVVELEAGKPTAQLGKTLSVLEALGCTLRIEPPASEPTGGDHD